MEPVNSGGEAYRIAESKSAEADEHKELKDLPFALKEAGKKLLVWTEQKGALSGAKGDVRGFVDRLSELAVAVEQGNLHAVATWCHGVAKPASVLAKRMHEERKRLAPSRRALGAPASSPKQVEASRSNGRHRRGITSAWKPRDLLDAEAVDGESWHRRQAQVLLGELVRDLQSGVSPPANLDVLIDHRVSIRIEREVGQLLQTPAFALARQALPSRWGPYSYSSLRFFRSKLKFITYRIKQAVTPEANFMIRCVPIGGGEIANLGPFSRGSGGESWGVSVKHLRNHEVFVRELNGVDDYRLVFLMIHPVLRLIRKEASRLLGPRTRVWVKIEWRGSNEVAEVGPFPARVIALRWNELIETEIYVRAETEPEKWHPLSIG